MLRVLRQSCRLADIRVVWQRSGTVLLPHYVFAEGAAAGDLVDHLGQGVVLRWDGDANCINCGQSARRLFSGGHCYDCSVTLARCDLCVVSPHRCHYHAGTCREPQWGEQFCMQPHTVYLAVSSGPKIGITRRGREHIRWSNQGATSALSIVAAPTRRAAGLVEAYFSRQVNDRTDWRRLVTGGARQVDLLQLADQLRRMCPDFADVTRTHEQAPQEASELAQLPAAEARQITWCVDGQVTQIQYPLQAYSPARRLNVEPGKELKGNLCGVLGQYLLLEQGVVNLDSLRGMDVHLDLIPRISESQLPRSAQQTLF